MTSTSAYIDVNPMEVDQLISTESVCDEGVDRDFVVPSQTLPLCNGPQLHAHSPSTSENITSQRRARSLSASGFDSCGLELEQEFPVYHEELVDYPGRPADAPHLYECFNHPLAPADAIRVLFFYMDTTYASMIRMYQHEKQFKVPYKRCDVLDAMGTCNVYSLPYFGYVESIL